MTASCVTSPVAHCRVRGLLFILGRRALDCRQLSRPRVKVVAVPAPVGDTRAAGAVGVRGVMARCRMWSRCIGDRDRKVVPIEDGAPTNVSAAPDATGEAGRVPEEVYSR